MKTRKTAQKCQYHKCDRLTRRYNCLCVRHRNFQPLVDKFNIKLNSFNNWKMYLEREKYGGIRNDWDLL